MKKTIRANHSNLSKEQRRILSGAYGKPARVPVFGLFCTCEEPHSYTWGRPGEVDPYFDASECHRQPDLTRGEALQTLRDAGFKRTHPLTKYSTGRLVEWALTVLQAQAA